MLMHVATLASRLAAVLPFLRAIEARAYRPDQIAKQDLKARLFSLHLAKSLTRWTPAITAYCLDEVGSHFQVDFLYPPSTERSTSDLQSSNC